MDHSFDSKIVKKGRKERQCFGCYGKKAIGESQEVWKGCIGRAVCESRVCMKCSRLINNHRGQVTDCGFMNEGAIKEIIDELDLETHEELETHLNKQTVYTSS